VELQRAGGRVGLLRLLRLLLLLRLDFGLRGALHLCVLLRGAGLGAALRRFGILLFGVVGRRRRAWTRRRRRALADRLAIVVADHHDDEFRLLGGDDLAHHLRPFHVAARVVADQARYRAVLAYDAEFRTIRECVLKPVGEPVGHRVADHHDRRRDRGNGIR
jgi:hypothetical protein